ncbi:MAG: glycosyltransferase, exosortase A system-associated [Methylomonas sp.]|nr:glycosyltransferase, exosortase A system-associated [Methylomonas sp.]PPD19756.1 MAG: glycosyltransferase, exosortase A system-associated [Methylomonas sp.]PPD25579.1 MAG: glycosyltransferase, exosortase A system-associated [Methylomonas sp.]PPD36479.1 MAG: glycosyltransferase, exosortase A system-associated [Methylomonas sp.]PPD40956.1 MAG: glycosyltransferase, exosortase A system-associated [Methylomonas sp.]
MKILHILDHSIPLHSGYTFRTRAILEQQRRLGWQTFHVTSAKHVNASAPVETVDGLTFYRSETPKGWLASLPVANQWAIVQSLKKRLDDLIPQIQPDILHAHSPALNGLAALAMARKYAVPLVYECRAFWEDAAVDHGTTTEGSVRYRLTQTMETHVFKRADAVTTICEGLRSDIIRRGIAADKITVIPNAVDVDKFSFGEAADPALLQSLGLTGKTVLGFIGSFYAYEGLLLLLDALPAVVQTRPDVHLLLVGGGPQADAIKQKIATLGLQAVVTLTGRVAHDQVPAYYNAIDLLVYPRLAMRLTDLVTPLKPLEAMAQGRLLVASDVGGHHELIRDRETGYLFKADDCQALAVTLLAAMADRANWDAMRNAGRRYVELERNWPISVSRYQAVYSGLLGSGQGSKHG